MIEVLDAGFYTSIQDLGRFGYRKFGVPVSGAMDGYSAKFANLLLGNNLDDAVIEMTMTGAKLKFKKQTQIVIAGANMSPRLDGFPVNLNKVCQVAKDSTLSFGRLINGFRSYIAIKGGLQSELLLKSRSLYVPLTKNYKLQSGDNIKISKNLSKISNTNANLKHNDSHFENIELEAFEGPEFKLLKQTTKERLLSKNFMISKNHNRMAYQLETKVSNSLVSILTAPVLPGTVQLTPSGQLIVLMRDCQTTGGYPRVLQLTENAINCLSQKQTGHSVKFRLNA